MGNGERWEGANKTLQDYSQEILWKESKLLLKINLLAVDLIPVKQFT